MSTPVIPRYSLMVLILGALACIGPMSIDAYLPAFGAISRNFELPPEQIQLTLGLYMLAFAFMTLLHGTLSDSFGRRRVILASLGVYTLGSIVASLAPSFEWLLVGRIGQGLSAGAGMVVGQAIVTDCYKGSVAQKTMSYIIMVFSVSPAFAPIIGGYLSEHAGWRAVFAFLAALAVFSATLCALFLPETLPVERRQPFNVRVLTHNYGRVMRDGQFMARAVVFGSLFGGFAFLIGAAPDFVTQVLQLPETAFGYLFIPIVIGLTSGSFLAARLSSSLSSGRLIGYAYAMLGLSCILNLAYTGLTSDLNVILAVLPHGLFVFGLSLGIPTMTLRILQRVPELSGTAASVLGFVQMIFFSIVSGWLAPFVYGSAFKLAVALTIGVVVSGLGWALVGRFSIKETLT
ncbi:multidrug effflux MFS transporter [Pseudomonas duriflava]|uniref:multidrug effflux MFS transporter n=1 Tax=Pseudomonas duriflava TaxID=459528 RepID=UPI001FCAD653|nr:multidrug effflux MFS transporter [Pseudomonas duriflava]